MAPVTIGVEFLHMGHRYRVIADLRPDFDTVKVEALDYDVRPRSHFQASLVARLIADGGEDVFA